MKRWQWIAALTVFLGLAAWAGSLFLARVRPTAPPAPAVARFLPTTPFEKKIVAGLRDQLSWGTGYDGSYRVISYPNGDVPRTDGACTDVVIRAYRYAGIDLQRLIHNDMVRDWKAYPHGYRLPAPDPNIDHRRVPNQKVYFERHWQSLTTSKAAPKAWQPGDVIEWRMPDHKTHTGVISDRLDNFGLPCVIENIGRGPEEDDALRADWKVIGHFRYRA